MKEHRNREMLLIMTVWKGSESTRWAGGLFFTHWKSPSYLGWVNLDLPLTTKIIHQLLCPSCQRCDLWSVGSLQSEGSKLFFWRAGCALPLKNDFLSLDSTPPLFISCLCTPQQSQDAVEPPLLCNLLFESKTESLWALQKRRKEGTAPKEWVFHKKLFLSFYGRVCLKESSFCRGWKCHETPGILLHLEECPCCKRPL